MIARTMFYILIDQLGPWLTEQGLYKYVMVLDQRGFRAFAAASIAFAIVLMLGPRVIKWLVRKKIGDAAQFDVAQLNAALASKANTPTMGGLLIAGAMLSSLLLMADLRNSYVQMALIVLVWLAAVGGADDWLKLTAASRGSGSRQGLYAWEKLVFQLGLGGLIGYFAFKAGYSASDNSLAYVLNLPFQKTYDSAVAPPSEGLIYLSRGMYILVMVLMMSGMSNAVNITDGLDGLASGVTAAVALGLMVLCFVAGSETTARQLLVPYVATADELAVVAAAVMGAVLGFLWWNCSPASVFMGDTGSLCLGGLLGYMAVVIRQEIVVLIMCGVFVLEIASVVIQVGYFKSTGGKRVFRCAPFHWHLHMGGWPEQKIVARFWILSVIFVAVALASLKLR